MTSPNPDATCGAKRLFVSGDDITCTETAGHRGGHFNRDYGSTWPNDERPVSLQHDACGALLKIELPTRIPTRSTLHCALGMGHQNMPHRAADGTQWDTATPEPPYADRVYLRPSDMERVAELERLAAPSEDGALNLGPIVERHTAAIAVSPSNPTDARVSMADVPALIREVVRLRRERAERPSGSDATIRSALDGISRQLVGMTEVWRELLNATCTGCRPVALSSNPEDGADLEVVPGCPVHSDAAELRRQVEWATQLHEQFCAALGPEYVGPFSADPTSAILRSIDTARQLDDVLRAAGIEHPTGLRGVEDLVSQRDGAQEDLATLERHVDIVLELVADALPDIDRTVPLPDVIQRVITTYRERGDR